MTDIDTPIDTPQGLAVRPEAPRDRDAVRRVHLAAFEPDPTLGHAAEADLVDWLRADGDLVKPCCLVAEIGGEIVGHVALSRGYVDRAPVLLGLGPIGVLPAHQGRGVGGVLMRAAIDAATRLGERGIVLLGHPTYYPRFGFRPAVDSGITPPGPWGPEHFLLLRLPRWDRDADGVAVAAPRGRFDYAPAFGRLPAD